jgi:hypothetical protein
VRPVLDGTDGQRDGGTGAPGPDHAGGDPVLTVFTRARWAVALALALTLASVLRYPGGTLLDRSSVGYAASRNFLSDLGMTVAHGGQANRLGALLFVASLIVLVLGLGACLVGFVRLYSATRARRSWGWRSRRRTRR